MTAREMMELWVVEYSLGQKAIHIQQVKEAMEGNIRMIRQGRANDYLMVGIARTHESASAIADRFQKKLDGFNG